MRKPKIEDIQRIKLRKILNANGIDGRIPQTTRVAYLSAIGYT